MKKYWATTALELMPMIWKLSWKLRPNDAYNLPTREDLVTAGFCGAMEAEAAYDPNQGTPFGSFAYHRIYGAMMDEMRGLDYLSRHSRQRAKAAERVAEFLIANEDGEVRGVGLIDATPLGYDAGRPLSTDHIAAAGIVVRETAPGPADTATRAVLLKEVEAEIAKLPDQMRYILRERLMGRTQVEIAADLGFTDTYVCQIEARAHRRLRVKMTAREVAAA